MILGFAILYEINIASLTILIRGVIGNIDPLFMVSSPVPVIKESYRLLSGNRREGPAYLGIAVYPHAFRKQRMTERKIRIILTCILFIDNQVRYQIHQQAAVFWKPPLQQLWEFVFIQDITDHDIGADPKAAAPVCFRQFLGKNYFRKVFLELLVWIHP